MGLRSFFSKVGRKITGTLRVLGNVILDLFGRAIYFYEFFFGFIFEHLFSKKIRLRVIILTKPDGNKTATIADVERCIEHAKTTLKSGANIKLLPYEDNFIEAIDEIAPSYVLNVENGIYVFGDEFQAAGAYFNNHKALFNNAITAYVIEDVIGSRGVSLGPLTDYVLIDEDGVKGTSSLVHEIGHACGLLDWTSDTFMNSPSAISKNRINWFQTNFLRSSRHTHIF